MSGRDWRAWFGLAWREDRRAAVLNDYAAMAQAHPLFLADLALRGNVWDDSPPPTDPIACGIYLGRRQISLETIKLCGKTPLQLQAYLAAPQPSETKR